MVLLSRGWVKRFIGGILGWFLGIGLCFLVAKFPKIVRFIFFPLNLLHVKWDAFATVIFFYFIMTTIGSSFGIWCVGYLQIKKYALRTFLFTFLSGFFGLVIGALLTHLIEYVREYVKYKLSISSFELFFNISWFLSLTLIPLLSAMMGFELGKRDKLKGPLSQKQDKEGG